ncbi:hypothetical protein [Nonomuraea phyllanthi]|uniref:hypothetical protein n=1 Tax=Nonomuraea phyllanthi TaxID=2219224 RepID=UPI001D13F567|nr:hypothetical protein [Nonomuraea phyllanthi]
MSAALPSSSLGRVVRGTGPGLLYPGTARTPRSEAPLSPDGLADELVATAARGQAEAGDSSSGECSTMRSASRMARGSYSGTSRAAALSATRA